MKQFWAIILFLIFVIISLVVIANVTLYRRATIPVIQSDSSARDLLHSFFDSKGIKLPENAHHLYAARRGWLMGAMYFGAFSLNSQQECDAFFKDSFDISIDDFEKVDELSQSFIYAAPDTWKLKYQDVNWQLEQESEVYLIGRNAYGIEVAFIPEKFRIYMIFSQD